ncbi:hypothetical protein G7Y89_g10673 [Cudoniella acicularis]|uniref:Carrier domain-containing protein n=1 Tax=Cudoniella acicularis TaxID=354080 RepID=A0A8H4RCA1_9HELO|nr:hypothetical protein G7Y89_g10673 [Cudoniella acicularis]
MSERGQEQLGHGSGSTGGTGSTVRLGCPPLELKAPVAISTDFYPSSARRGWPATLFPPSVTPLIRKVVRCSVRRLRSDSISLAVHMSPVISLPPSPCLTILYAPWLLLDRSFSAEPSSFFPLEPSPKSIPKLNRASASCPLLPSKMAPMILDSPLPEVVSNSTPICSDASVVPPETASKRIKDLWWLHGHPHSKRYSNPKLVSLAALVRHNGVVYRGEKGFLYPQSSEASTPYDSMTWDRFDRVTDALAFSYAHQLEAEIREANISREQPTIALLGGGKSLEYFCTELALQKLGALAVITDFKNSGVDTNGVRKLPMIEVLPAAADSQHSAIDAVKFQDFGDVWERHTFIIHSSGSTGMPKPIVHTNKSMMLIARMYRLFQEFSVENWFLLFPLYHIAGISIALSGLPNGQILSFPPLAWPPSSSSIFTAWKTLLAMGHPVDIVHCAPTLIENMYEYISENGGDFSPLIELQLLQPGGAALSDYIVKALTARGVNVKTTYGSTEIGPPFRSIPHTRDNPKCYSFRNLYPDNPHLKMEEVGEGLYECVVYKGFELAAQLWESSDDPYRTNDLFIQDPPGSGFFVMQGRKDDILVHSNGENTTAGPLQLDIQTSSKIISRALALGHSKPCVSLLVEVHGDFDPESDTTQKQIWETVEQINLRYPGHSQIMQHMICVLRKGQTLPVTPKGNVKRKEAELLYSAEINQLYSDSTSPFQLSISPSEALTEHLRSLLSSISKTPSQDIHDWTSLYDLGIDSRLALCIRSSLSTYLKRPVSLSTIFENPSISKLVSALLLTPPSSPGLGPSREKISVREIVGPIISRLEAEFKSWPTRPANIHTIYPDTGKETVLLTGASGSLGTSLIANLSSYPQVEKIYAMVRGPNHLAKLRKSFDARGMDSSILVEGGKVEVVNFSMQDPLLGLDLEKYIELASRVTIVVQNAWKMDFNLGVEGFEGDCLRNTMSLLRFCQAARPKRLAFTSSISTCMGSGHTSPTVAEEPIGVDPNAALSTGYAQSKYIVERITQTATRILQIPIHLLRIGQLAGSTRTGHWNTSEMWPILFATSLHPSFSSIPTFLSKSVDWIPVDIAAATITDILLTKNLDSESKYEVHNIVNPHPIPWSSLIHMLQSQRKDLQEIPMGTWVKRLNTFLESGMNADELPGLRLLQFFEGMAGDESESKVFKTGKTQKISASLRGCEAFCEDWLRGNLRVWGESGFLK